MPTARSTLELSRQWSSFLSLIPQPLGLGLLAMAPQVPPSAPAVPSAQSSPLSAEALCLKTFQACWFLDKDWLVSFIASAQCLKLDAPITWVEFIPKGHTHLVRCALKLVPPTCVLLVTKIKECMFTFVLSVLNGPGSSPGFFNTHEATKPRKRTHKCKDKGDQSTDMAVDAPEPCTAAQSSSWEPEAPTPSGAGDSDPPPLEGSSKPSAFTWHFPSPSSEEPRNGGSSLEDPCTSRSSTLLPLEPEPPASSVALTLSAHTCKLLRAREKIDTQLERQATFQSPSPAPSIASVLGKCPPSPLLSPTHVGLPCCPGCAGLAHLDVAQAGQLSL